MFTAFNVGGRFWQFGSKFALWETARPYFEVRVNATGSLVRIVFANAGNVSDAIVDYVKPSILCTNSPSH